MRKLVSVTVFVLVVALTASTPLVATPSVSANLITAIAQESYPCRFCTDSIPLGEDSLNNPIPNAPYYGNHYYYTWWITFGELCNKQSTGMCKAACYWNETGCVPQSAGTYLAYTNCTNFPDCCSSEEEGLFDDCEEMFALDLSNAGRIVVVQASRPTTLYVNRERRALQVINCDGDVVASTPYPYRIPMFP
jgi:hypothetical protein